MSWPQTLTGLSVTMGLGSRHWWAPAYGGEKELFQALVGSVLQIGVGEGRMWRRPKEYRSLGSWAPLRSEVREEDYGNQEH